jgi:hypothetical protein
MIVYYTYISLYQGNIGKSDLGALLGASAPWKGTEISQHYKDGLGSAKNELVQVLDAMQSKT